MPLARSGSTTAYSTSLTALSGYVAISPYTSIPFMDGAGAAGGSALYSRGDHVHPSDTSKASLSGAVFTGPVTLAGDATAALQAVTKQQLDALTTAAGYAPLASPVFTGNPQAPTPTAGDNDTSLATTQFVQSAIAAAPYSNNTGRNLLHNGTFVVQQRGTGPFTSAVYTLDRWVLGITGDTVSVTATALSDADRTAIGDDGAAWALQNVFTGSGASGQNMLQQYIEDVRRLSNKTVTLSFWAKCASGTLKLGLNIAQVFGSGGSAAAYALTTGNVVTISTTWARYTTTIAIPSVAGKTVGTNNDHFTLARIYFSAGASSAGDAYSGHIGAQSGTIQLWGVQLEIGSVATPLAKRDPADELALCQRFYQIGGLFGQANIAAAGATYSVSSLLPVPMRASPIVTLSGNANINISSPVSGALGANAVYSGGTVTTGGAQCNINVNFVASADL